MSHLVLTLALAVTIAVEPSPVSAGDEPAQAGAAAAKPAAPAAAQPAPEAASAEPILLASEADVRRVCDAASPAGRGPSGGGVVDRAEAEARSGDERERALGARYRVVLPGDGLRFAAWSPEGKVLELARHGLPSAAGGAARLAAGEDAALPVRADAAAVRRIVAAQKEKKLSLRVTFELPEEEADAPCFHVPGARSWTISAEPVAWEYAAGDEVLARGGEGGDRPVVSARAGAKPHVQVGEAAAEGEAKALRGAVLGRVGELEGCYASALGRDPFLDGSMVADLSRGRGEGVRIAADSTNDAALVACVQGVLARLDLRAAPRGYLPIRFVLEGPGDAGSAGQ